MKNYKKPGNRTGQVCLGGSNLSAKWQAIIDNLASHSLTAICSRNHLGIMLPGSRICELRKMDYKISTHLTTEPMASGKLHRVARYVLEPNDYGA